MVSRVFIAHDDHRFDFKDAYRFGTRVVVVDSPNDSTDFYPDTIDEKMPGLVEQVRWMLMGFNPALDYLCLVGSPVIQVLCIYELGQRRFERPIRVLRFDSHERAYYPITLGVPVADRRHDVV